MQDDSSDDLRARLATVADPIAFLEGLFAAAPVGFQIYRRDGHCLLTNRAFRELFGSEPPPEYCIFNDEIAEARGVLGLIRRAFAGETVATPAFWYDPRELKHVTVTEGRRVAISGTFFPVLDRDGAVAHVGIVFKDVTAELSAREHAEAKQRDAEAARARFAFLAEASAALSGSLDFAVTLAKVARLTVPRVADWCTIAVIGDDGELRRLAAVHRDPSCEPAVREYIARFPPGRHRAGELHIALHSPDGVLSPVVTDDDLAAAAQDPDHLRVLRALGCASCIMVPMRTPRGSLGVISLMRDDPQRPFGPEDLTLAQELAARAALAVENARRFSAAEQAEAVARRQTERLAVLADASATFAAGGDSQALLRALAAVCVPRMADWCSIDLTTARGLESVAIAHVDPSKVEAAARLRRQHPPDMDAAFGPANVLRTGRAELYAQIDDALLSSAARDAEHLAQLRAVGMGSAIVAPLVARGGTLGVLTLVWAESGRRYGAEDLDLVTDLARRCALAVENARLTEDLRGAVQIREEFLAIAGHELRTPLAALTLQVDGLRHVVGRMADAAPLAARLNRVAASAARLAHLVDQLLDVSRITAGRLELAPEPLDLRELVGEVVDRFREAAGRAGTTITVVAPTPVRGTWDRLRLDQVVTNLIANAIKYGRGKPVEVAVAAEAADAVLRVVDRGIGIDAEQQQRIFLRFERAAEARKYGGFGLGLWIARRIVDASGGTIAVTSAPGEGATFTVRLPAALEAPAGARPGDPAAAVDARRS